MTIAVSAPGPDDRTPERELTEMGDKLMQSRGYEIAPSASKALNPTSGYPQRIYLKPGRMVVVEYIKQGGKLTKKQQEWAEVITSIAKASTSAVTYLEIEPSDWHLLKEAAI